MGDMAELALQESLDDYWPSDYDRGAADYNSYRINHMATTSQQRPVRKGAPPPARRTQSTDTNGSLKSSNDFISGSDKGLFGTPPFSIVCHGPPGIGKTSMWAYLPDVGYIHDPQERGIIKLARFNRVPNPKWVKEARDFNNVRNLLADVCTGKFGIKNLVIDSGTGFEKLCFHYHCAENYDNDWSKGGFYAFQSGPKNAAKTDWPEFLSDLDAVRESGVSTILILHTQVKTFTNPTGTNYDKFTPYLDKETWAQTHRWAEAVLFYNQYVEVKKGVGDKGKPQQDTLRRLIYTEPDPCFEAKNWWGLDPIINAGTSAKEAYDGFCKAYRKAAGV